MPHTSDNGCECEHESHFGDEVDHPTVSTSHPYGYGEPEVELKTIFGTFHICKQCASAGHMVID